MHDVAKDCAELVTALGEDKAIIIGRTVILFGKPRVAVGFVGDGVAFACDNPQTLEDARVLVYLAEELAEFLGEGSLEGAIDL